MAGVALLCGLLWAAPAGAAVYWSNAGTNAMGRANLDGSAATQNLFPTSSTGIGAAVDGQYIYWNDSYGIGRANRDGTGVQANFIPDTLASGVAVDGQHIYWGHDGGNGPNPQGSIWRANLDGTNPQQIVTGIGGGAVDGVTVSGQFVYWTNFWGSTIGRANLDGSNSTQALISTAHTPMGIAVDGQYIYWATEYDGTIARANLNGSGVNLSFISGVDKGTSNQPISVVADDQHIYWTNYASGRIGRANIDGSNPNQNFITGASTPQGLAHDGPSSLAAPTIIGSPTPGATLTEAHGSWTPGPTFYTYQWLRCDSAGNNCSPIDGATGQSYGVSGADGGSALRVQEFAFYGGTVSAPGTSSAVAVPAPVTSASTAPATSTPPPPPPPTAGLSGISASGESVTITLTCSGVSGQTCSETINGTVTEHKRAGVVMAVTARKHHKRGGKSKGTQTLTVNVASASVAIPAGQGATVHLPLNGTGAQLLTKLGRLPVNLAFAGALNTSRTVVITPGHIHVSTPPDSWYHINLPCTNCFTQAQSVPLTGLPSDAHVTITCKGAGCPFATRSVTPHHGQINLASVLGGSHLEPGTKVQVVISARGRVGETIVYTMQRGNVPFRKIG